MYAPDIERQLTLIQKKLAFPHLDRKRIICFRSFGSKARARARIWAFPKIWQLALKQKPAYCIEVLSEKFDHLSSDDQAKILIHELLHVPKNFSGALLPHHGRGRLVINSRSVEELYDQFISRR